MLWRSKIGNWVRLSWLIIGHITLLLLGVVIAVQRIPLWTLWDYAFAGVAFVTLFCRYIDLRSGINSAFDPMALADWKRYRFVFCFTSVSAWGLVHFVGWVQSA